MLSRKLNQCDPLTENFKSLEDFWEFWDTHSTADYEDLMEDVDVQIDLRRSKRYYPVAKGLINQLKTQARQQGVSTATLINLWLKEKMMETVKSKEEVA